CSRQYRLHDADRRGHETAGRPYRRVDRLGHRGALSASASGVSAAFGHAPVRDRGLNGGSVGNLWREPGFPLGADGILYAVWIGRTIMAKKSKAKKKSTKKAAPARKKKKTMKSAAKKAPKKTAKKAAKVTKKVTKKAAPKRKAPAKKPAPIPAVEPAPAPSSPSLLGSLFTGGG